MPVNNNFRLPDRAFRPDTDYIKKLADILRLTVLGKTNNAGEVELETGVTETAVDNILCNENSVVILSAVTGEAAFATTGGIYVVAGDKTFTIHHPVGGGGEIFRYVVIG